MKEKKEFTLRKGDWLAVALVLLLAVIVALFFFPREKQGEVFAEIYQNGEKIQTLSLAEDQSFTVTGHYTNEITVADGHISITRSDCPGEDCVHSGSIASSGRSIVCLPNKVEIRIVSQDGDVDFVVR